MREMSGCRMWCRRILALVLTGIELALCVGIIWAALADDLSRASFYALMLIIVTINRASLKGAFP